MKYLYICPNVEKERVSAKNRRAYLNRLEGEGKLTKKDSVLQRRIDIKTMLDEGKDRAVICKELGISSKTFSRDVIIIVANNIVSRPKDAIKSACESAKLLTECIANAIESATSSDGTKIQPPNYKRTSFACSDFVFWGGGLCLLSFVFASLFLPFDSS